MSKGIGHEGEPAPRAGLNRPLQYSTSLLRPLYGKVDIRDHHVDVHGSPVPVVPARISLSTCGLAPCCLHQQIDPGGCAEEFHAAGAETTTSGKVEGRGVELLGRGQIIDIDVDEKIQRAASGFDFQHVRRLISA